MAHQTSPLEALEKQAKEQRKRVQDSVQQLRQSVSESMEINSLLKGHFLPIAALTAIVGVSLGYSFASIFRAR